MIYKLAETFRDLKNELAGNELFDVYARYDDNEALMPGQLTNQLINLNGEEDEAADSYVPEYTFGLADSFKEVIEATWKNMMQYQCTFEKDRFYGAYSFNHPYVFLDEDPGLTDLVAQDHKDYEVIKNLKVFDNTHVKYQFGCIHYPPGASRDIFESNIYLFQEEHLVPLRLTFRTYLESCAACMACENWQLLFADPDEVAGYPQQLNRLKTAYQALSAIFPGKDFELFRKQLAVHKLL